MVWNDLPMRSFRWENADIRFRGQPYVDSPTVVVNAPFGGAPGISPPIRCESRQIGGMMQTTCWQARRARATRLVGNNPRARSHRPSISIERITLRCKDGSRRHYA
jgi:hypothetical protein